jgi:NADH dehydrogenase [ubiquinone] 1 alpha subcomplex assembly factor 3
MHADASELVVFSKAEPSMAEHGPAELNASAPIATSLQRRQEDQPVHLLFTHFQGRAATYAGTKASTCFCEYALISVSNFGRGLMRTAWRSLLYLQQLRHTVQGNVNDSFAITFSQISTLERPLPSISNTSKAFRWLHSHWIHDGEGATRRGQSNKRVNGVHSEKSIGYHRKVTSRTATEELDLTPPDVGTVRIDGYDDTGFIVGDVQVEGSILCFGDLWLSWKPRRISEITDDSLVIVDLLKPSPDLVILGTGQKIQRIPDSLSKSLFTRGVSLEVLDTINAVATFNILNQEGRKVVGALLPFKTDVDPN